jgi:hypothetical protein
MRNRTNAKIVENSPAFIRNHPMRARPKEVQDVFEDIMAATRIRFRNTEMQSASLDMGPSIRMRPYD